MREAQQDLLDIARKKEPAPAEAGTSSKNNNSYSYDSTDTLICQALKLGRIACEIGAEVEYQDGVFIIYPEEKGDK